ncbi:MAG TPA: hypothetical protein VES65_11430 [Solirubrobacteraceae bacterium]|nr:hypothetical protein [Solirubrobacteraceae bacterium]
MKHDINPEEFPALAHALDVGAVVIDGDGDYRIVDGAAFGHPGRPVKLSSRDRRAEASAEKLLIEKLGAPP